MSEGGAGLVLDLGHVVVVIGWYGGGVGEEGGSLAVSTSPRLPRLHTAVCFC